MQTTPYSFAIVGGGIIGLSIAVSLQQRGLSVLLLDKGKVASGASFGNAGHIATEQVFPIADRKILRALPRMLLDPLGPLHIDWRYLATVAPWMLKLLTTMRKRPAQHIHHTLTALNAAAWPAWQAFIQQWKLADLVRTQGSLLVTETPKGLDQLHQQHATLQQLDIPVQFLSETALQDMEPHLATSQIGALFFQNTGHVVDLVDLQKRLTQRFLALGGTVQEHTQINAIQRGSPLTLHSAEKKWRADYAVIACGAFSKPLVKQTFGITVPLETERGYHLMLPHEALRLRLPVSSIDRRFIMTPMNHGLRLAGTVEFAGLKRAPNMRRAHNLLPLAQGMLRSPLCSLDATAWMGFRPTLVDSLPIIDKQDNCYLAFGHQHLGLTHAPLTAQIIQALHFQETLPMECSALSIQRFQSR